MAKLVLTENQLELLMTALDWARATTDGISKEDDEDIYTMGKRLDKLDEQLTRQIQKRN